MRTDAGFGRAARGAGSGVSTIVTRAGRSASTNRSNTASASSGPGAPSGWYWTVSMGSSAWRSPSTERSLRLSWLTRNPDDAGRLSPTTWTSWFCAVTWT